MIDIFGEALFVFCILFCSAIALKEEEGKYAFISKGETILHQHYHTSNEFINTYMAYLYPAYELMNNKMEDFEFSLIMNIDDEDYEHIMMTAGRQSKLFERLHKSYESPKLGSLHTIILISSDYFFYKNRLVEKTGAFFEGLQYVIDMKEDIRPNRELASAARIPVRITNREATTMISIIKDEYKLCLRDFKANANGGKVDFLRMNIVTELETVLEQQMEFAYDWHDGLTTKLLADVESSISSEKTTYIYLIRTAARYRVAMLAQAWRLVEFQEKMKTFGAPTIIFASFDGSNENRQQIIQTIFEAAGKEDRVTVIQNGDADFNFDKSSDTQKILDICQQFVRDFKSSAAMST